MPQTGRRTCAVVTVSDRVSAKAVEDHSGPALVRMLEAVDWRIVNSGQPFVVPDEIPAIQTLVKRLVDEDNVSLVVTTGGTGFAPRDVTPEAISGLLDKLAPGLTITMVTASLEKTAMAGLSRPVCGIRRRSVIITLPGSTKGCIENLEPLLLILPHAIELARGDMDAAENTHQAMSRAGMGPDDAQQPAQTNHHHQHHHHHHHHQPARHSGVHIVSHSEPDVSQGHHHHHHHHHTHRMSAPTGGNDDNVTLPVAMRARTSPFPMVSYDDALATVLQHAMTRDRVAMNLADCLGYVLADDARAAEDVPSFRASIVDGYAVVDTDGPGTYPVASTTTAGSAHSLTSTPLKPGQIARITTGAPLPPGATAVVMVEDTVLIESSHDGLTEVSVQITGSGSIAAGANVREIGSDVSKGTTVLPRGARLSPGELALLASVGAATAPVAVIAKPSVVVVSTGNEIRDPAEKELVVGHTRDSNKYFLMNALKEEGFHAEAVETVKDSAPQLADTIRAALNDADVLITTGGVSMGEMDLLKPVLERALGATVHFGRVNMKPGKPTTFATLMHNGVKKLVFALPGNPASVAVTFQLFVLPALRKMAGHPTVLPPKLNVELAEPIRLDPQRPEFHRAHVTIAAAAASSSASSTLTTNRLVATSTGSQRSSRVLSLCAANALLCLPAGSGTLAAGATVDAMLVRGLEGALV
ncbi:hypothetical protein HDU87_007428 [Geranomyces variabilis]|uniref:MoaB/Mog domain-containing protein n=1 Tax=Geranomyces variabilis TaxID=109894 RepID=A0AAD5XQ83_9FUNG|nr:hypothetical protein HDU87_007428 [Geranomyces variabilis]